MVTETIQPIVGTFNKDTGEFLGIGPAGVTATPLSSGSSSQGEAIVTVTETGTQIRTKVQTTGTPAEENSPAGVGRRVIYPSAMLTALQTNLSTMQSLQGAGKGSTLLSFSFGGVDPGTGTYAMFAVLDDSDSVHGLRGQGSLRDFAAWGNSVTKGGTVALDRVVHGYSSDIRSEGVAHTMMDVDWLNFTGDGVHIGAGNDQMMLTHVRSEGNDGWGYWIVGASDCKSRACGAQGNKTGGVHVESSATFRWRDFDVGNPNGTIFEGTYTVELIDMTRASFDTGEISGRVLVSGRNDQGVGVRYEESQNTFRNVSFKIDENLPGAYAAHGKTGQYTCQVSLVDVDGTIFDNCRLMYGDVDPTAPMLAATPDYFIEISSTVGGGSTANRRGWCKFSNMGGLVHRRGRFGDMAPTLAFKKHYCNFPNLVEWDIPVGEVVEIMWDVSNPPRDWVLAPVYGSDDPILYNKSDYPLGYLWNVVGGTLDDVNTTFPVYPASRPAAAGKAFATPVWA